MYAVVNNLSTLGLSQAQNPWIMIYTRPDSGTNATGWYKSKLFFGSNAHTDVNGIKLLYTGTDPTDVHPEITGNNRINLLFNLSLSTKPLADASTESILFGTLQTTNNTSTVGSFNFAFSQFGISWVKQLVPLPIVDNTVVVSGNVNVIAPTTYSTRVKTAGNTPVQVNEGGYLLSFIATNTSATIDAFIKLYDSVATPDPATDVPFMIVHVSRDATILTPVIQVDTANLKITNKLWVRAVTGASDTNTDATGLSLDICFFRKAT
jgi:hypothetical protein